MEKHSSNLITKSFKGLFKRFHLLIFFVFIVGCLAAVVISVTQILSRENDEAVVLPTNSSTIDQATLQQIRLLHQSNAAPTPDAPADTANPFSH